MFSFFKKKKTVAHIKLSGVIGNAGKFKQGIDFAGQEELIKKAFSLKKAVSVAITINSPGGSPVQSHLIYSLIRQEAKKNKKKVIVFAEDVAASGGYLIACAGDEIYANSSSIIGSIGVIYSSFGFTELIKKITHVAISINSPGGSPVQSHLIYSYIRQLAEKNKVKVIIFAEDVAASGGYLISCAGDEIYANSSSIIGSIGVISASFGFKDLIKKIGVERRVYTAGKNKSTLDPFVDEKEEDVKRLKSIQLELHADFIRVVERSRGSKLKDPEKNNIFTGEFWTGKTSLNLGLIDGIGNADQILKEKFGDKVIIKNFEKPKGFIARKLSSSIQDPVDRLVNLVEEKSMWQKFGL